MAPTNKNLKSIDESQTEKRANLAKWRASRLHKLTLPSGLTVQVVDVTMTDLAMTGKLPPALATMAKQAARNGAQEFDLAKAVDDLDFDELFKNGPEFMQLMNQMAMMAVKDPPIAEHGDDDHLGLDDLSGDDKLAIFNWINRESAAVQPFRDETKPVSSGPAGKTILDEAQ